MYTLTYFLLVGSGVVLGTYLRGKFFNDIANHGKCPGGTQPHCCYNSCPQHQHWCHNYKHNCYLCTNNSNERNQDNTK
ncbi:hypothetical protein M8J76_002282 [Diaphorina citri]|nr:hypothetical protein M8J75_003260 [Diaphorina citri]KAI5744441.1 hypothetical protein M8J76_002282 [Diaphorina citri]